MTRVEALRIPRGSFQWLVAGSDVPDRMRHLREMRANAAWATINSNSVLRYLTSSQKTQLEEYVHRRVYLEGEVRVLLLLVVGAGCGCVVCVWGGVASLLLWAFSHSCWTRRSTFGGQTSPHSRLFLLMPAPYDSTVLFGQAKRRCPKQSCMGSAKQNRRHRWSSALVLLCATWTVCSTKGVYSFEACWMFACQGCLGALPLAMPS